MSQIEVSIEGSIATLLLARPEARNALTDTMGVELSSAVAKLNARSDVRAVILRGEGKTFCAGGDLAFIEQRAACDPAENRRAMRRFYEYFLSMRTLRAPTIAVLHGATMGAGVCLALACDLRICDTEATMSFNFVRLGLHPGMGASYLLPRLVGPAYAAELLLTGKVISAAEARRIGLCNEVHLAADLLPAAEKLAQQIAAAAPLAVAHTKRTLATALDLPLEELLDAEAHAQSTEYGTADLAEGVRAIRERRVPRFEGM